MDKHIAAVVDYRREQKGNGLEKPTCQFGGSNIYAVTAYIIPARYIMTVLRRHVTAHCLAAWSLFCPLAVSWNAAMSESFSPDVHIPAIQALPQIFESRNIETLR